MELTIFIKNFKPNIRTLLDHAGTITLLINHKSFSHDEMFVGFQSEFLDMKVNQSQYQSLIPSADNVSYGKSLEFIENMLDAYKNNREINLTVYEE